MVENQHYVPQFLLKHFARGKKKNKVWVFDKHADKAFQTSVRNIASEKGFYELEAPGDGDNKETRGAIESHFSKMEQKAHKAIRKLIQSEKLNNLSSSELDWIIAFVATQYLRTKQFRNILINFSEALTEKLRALGQGAEKIKGFKSLNDNSTKAESLFFSAKNIHEIVNIISNKNVLLLKTRNIDPFYISDNPVILHNDNDLRPYGNLGLASPGIQIYIPLSHKLILGFWCPSLHEEFKNNQSKVNEVFEDLVRNRDLNPFFDRQKCAEGIDTTEKVISQMDSYFQGKPMPCDSENVKFFNSGQVIFSARYVYSRENNFDLVRKMIADNPKFKKGKPIVFD